MFDCMLAQQKPTSVTLRRRGQCDNASSKQPMDLVRLSVRNYQLDKQIRFLRRVPVDPMTGEAEWGMRSNRDDPDSSSWGGENVSATKAPMWSSSDEKPDSWRAEQRSKRQKPKRRHW